MVTMHGYGLEAKLRVLHEIMASSKVMVCTFVVQGVHIHTQLSKLDYLSKPGVRM